MNTEQINKIVAEQMKEYEPICANVWGGYETYTRPLPCAVPCVTSPMMGRSWWKSFGYGSMCGCAWKALEDDLTEKAIEESTKKPCSDCYKIFRIEGICKVSMEPEMWRCFGCCARAEMIKNGIDPDAEDSDEEDDDICECYECLAQHPESTMSDDGHHIFCDVCVIECYGKFTDEKRTEIELRCPGYFGEL